MVGASPGFFAVRPSAGSLVEYVGAVQLDALGSVACSTGVPLRRRWSRCRWGRRSTRCRRRCCPTLGEVDDAVVDGQAAVVVVLPRLVRTVAEFGDVEVAVGRRCARVLVGLGRVGRGEDLRPGPVDDGGRLGVGAVAGVADREDRAVVPVLRVDHGGPAVVAAERVGLGEGEVSPRVHLGHRPVDGIGRVGDGRVDFAGSVGIGGVDRPGAAT